MALRRRQLLPARARVRRVRKGVSLISQNFSAHQRNFRAFGMGGGTGSSDFNAPPRKGKGPGKNGGLGSNGGSHEPPRGRGFGTSGSSPEPNPRRKLTQTSQIALAHRQRITKRWKAVGLSVALASALGLGWLFFRKPLEKQPTPIYPPIENTHSTEKNGRKPFDGGAETPNENTENHPQPRTEEEIQREKEDARVRRENSKLFRQNFSFKRIYSRDGKLLFLPEKESLEGINEFLQQEFKPGTSVADVGYHFDKPAWKNTGLVNELPSEYNKPGTIVKMAMFDERGTVRHTYLIIGEVNGRPHEFYPYPRGIYGTDRKNTGMTGSVIQTMQESNGFMAVIDGVYLPDPKKNPWKK